MNGKLPLVPMVERFARETLSNYLGVDFVENMTDDAVEEALRAFGATAAGFPTQQQTLDWVRERWPDATDPKSRALKLGEEAGEVQGAVVKMSEGRATLDDLRMESAQLVICVMALAESAGFDLWDAVIGEYMRATRSSPKSTPEQKETS